MTGLIVNESAKVLIIGGGIGGLALAQGLKKHDIPFHVYECDASANFRPQGYRLKLPIFAADALKSLLSDALWAAFTDMCAESFAGETNFNAINGTISHSRRGPGPRTGPTPYLADRSVLRAVLRTGLEAHISYGKRFVSYTTDETGITATFADGTQHHGRLLVGADGVKSPVRLQFQPSHKLVDTGGRCIYGKTPLNAALVARFPPRATKWMTLIVDRTPMTQCLDVDDAPLTLLLEPVRFPPAGRHRGALPPDYVYWVLIGRAAAFPLPDAQLLRLSGPDAAALSLDMTEEWHADLRALFELQTPDEARALRISSAKPDLPAWQPDERVTLIGDAVHAMSPCGGVGAATAIKDAAVLAARIAELGVGLAAVAKYEAEMRVYAGASIERSYAGGLKMFGQKPFAECDVVEP